MLPRGESRPEEFHRPAPRRTERETLASLRSHQVTIPFVTERNVCRTQGSSCRQLPQEYNDLTRSLCSSPITEPSSLLRIEPHRHSRLMAFATCASPLASKRLVPSVPRKSLHPIHAPSTPAAVRPVIRQPTDSSQRNHTPLVLATSGYLTTRLRWVYFRSSLGHTPAQGISLNFGSNAHHHGSLPQQPGVV
jgi:hypothetical protein